MKQVSLIWSLLIILIIFFGSMPTASALKCYQGGGKKGDKLDQKECQPHPHIWCVKETNGDHVISHCGGNPNGDKEGCHESKVGSQTVTDCYCKTDLCNGSIPLGQMSRWLFFSLSIVVPWMSRALFAH